MTAFAGGFAGDQAAQQTMIAGGLQERTNFAQSFASGAVAYVVTEGTDTAARLQPATRQSSSRVDVPSSAVPTRLAGAPALAAVPARYRAAVTRSFRGEAVAETLTKDLIVYRHWGGKALETGSPWFSPKPYVRAGNAQRFLALPEGNAAHNVTAFRIPAGTTILRGKVAPQAGEIGFGGHAVGGGEQIYLPDPSVAVPIR
jgi:hypothetical protein